MSFGSPWQQVFACAAGVLAAMIAAIDVRAESDVMLQALSYILKGELDSPYVEIKDRKNCVVVEKTNSLNSAAPITFYFNNISPVAVTYRRNSAGWYQMTLSGDGKPVADVVALGLGALDPPSLRGPQKQFEVVLRGDLARTQRAIALLYSKFCKGVETPF